MSTSTATTVNDGKYEIAVDTGDHRPIGEDEPVFLLRAQDEKSIDTIRFYSALCAGEFDEAYGLVDELIHKLNENRIDGSPPEHSAALSNTLRRFTEWQTMNKDSVKTPD